jgi:hypothetical protein
MPILEPFLLISKAIFDDFDIGNWGFHYILGRLNVYKEDNIIYGTVINLPELFLLYLKNLQDGTPLINNVYQDKKKNVFMGRIVCYKTYCTLDLS